MSSELVEPFRLGSSNTDEASNSGPSTCPSPKFWLEKASLRTSATSRSKVQCVLPMSQFQIAERVKSWFYASVFCSPWSSGSSGILYHELLLFKILLPLDVKPALHPFFSPVYNLLTLAVQDFAFVAFAKSPLDSTPKWSWLDLNMLQNQIEMRGPLCSARTVFLMFSSFSFTQLRTQCGMIL